jgi:hypothetical protein
VLETFQQRYLADGSGRDTVVLLLQTDLLECDSLSRDFIDGLVDYTVSALAQLIELLIAIYLGRRLDELLLLAIRRGRDDTRAGLLAAHILGLRESGAVLASHIVIWVVVFHGCLV